MNKWEIILHVSAQLSRDSGYRFASGKTEQLTHHPQTPPNSKKYFSDEEVLAFLQEKETKTPGKLCGSSDAILSRENESTHWSRYVAPPQPEPVSDITPPAPALEQEPNPRNEEGEIGAISASPLKSDDDAVPGQATTVEIPQLISVTDRWPSIRNGNFRITSKPNESGIYTGTICSAGRPARRRHPLPARRQEARP